MSDILLNDQGDLDIQNGDLVLTAQTEAISQALTQNLRTFLGEWFLDSRVGVPYFQQVLVKQPDPVVLDSIFKGVIVNTPGVLELLEFDLDVDTNRVLTLTFKASTATGDIDFSEALTI